MERYKKQFSEGLKKFKTPIEVDGFNVEILGVGKDQNGNNYVSFKTFARDYGFTYNGFSKPFWSEEDIKKDLALEDSKLKKIIALKIKDSKGKIKQL